MDINMIVAVGKDGAIGRNGDLVWHISDDLKRFKQLTMGHPVIMGRKTWESLPRKPLPGRENIVLTHNRNFDAEGATVVHSPEEALEISANKSPFIMGGAKVYETFLPWVNNLFLTEIDASCNDADAFLGLNLGQWEIVDKSDWHESVDGLRFRYVEYKNSDNKQK